MAILTDQEIEQGINTIAASRPCPFAGMGAFTWAYFLKFTAHFEGPVNFMYSNKDLDGVVGPDVTVGVGISIPSRNSVAMIFAQITFYVKGTNCTKPATLQQVQADYDKVAAMSRPVTPLAAYYDAVQTEIKPADVLKKLPDKVIELVPSRLRIPEAKDFADWPAQAQVAFASYCYGISTQRAPKMRKALSEADFDTAGRESYIPGWSPLKVLGHRKLFWNAARLVEANQNNMLIDIDRLPDRFDGDISIIPFAGGPVLNPPRRPDMGPP